ncbi:YggT family protein [Polynucleobacter sp. TUM22923]|jgi:YggT family protein|uniref:YggT family protein n=1 Tax=Polynucleobacter sp. TUM22923 TaxID=3022126 RepID=UPI002572F4B4|nr:YggT family protein [Polynucleobacter sp. TUM22923]BDX21035.1 YggT family protein [Polynucleobacter sp. TUM22923]
MIFQISNLLLQALVTIIGGACLIRCYMQFFHINLGRAGGYQISSYLLSLTNWIILPLRKALPSVGRLDTASLVAAYLIALCKIGVLWFLSGAPLAVGSVLLMGIFELINLFLSGVIGAVFISIILSWFAATSIFYYFLSELTEPLLQPFRNVLPKMGMIDLSPLVLLLAVQILQVVVANVQMALLS